MKNILVLCTGNRCRSQMAEGWIRHFAAMQAGDAAPALQVASAGVKPSQVHPLAIKVMAEAGVTLDGQTSKHVDQYLGQPFDLVVTVCDSARETCPTLPGAKRTLHHGFEDPDKATGTEDEILTVFRRVRDEIRDWAKELTKVELKN